MKPPHKGWPNYLAEKHNVTNVATPGVGQWKIWKQVEKADLDKFDTVIVSVGTPNRVYCKTHPIHKEGMHKHSDLMYMDIDRRSWFNKELTTAKNWFLYFYDQEYLFSCDAGCAQRTSSCSARKFDLMRSGAGVVFENPFKQKSNDRPTSRFLFWNGSVIYARPPAKISIPNFPTIETLRGSVGQNQSFEGV